MGRVAAGRRDRKHGDASEELVIGIPRITA
jgi:hypothetical protein